MFMDINKTKAIYRIGKQMGAGAVNDIDEWCIRCKHCWLLFTDFSRFKDHLELWHPDLYPDLYPDIIYHAENVDGN